MFFNLKQITKIILTKPVDLSTSVGRSQDRYRRAALTSLVMIAARVSNILTGILTVPITLKYLGEDLFGVWMVLTSVVAFLSFYDFGLGVGLRNLIIECTGKDDRDTPKKLIGNALLLLTGLAALMIIAVWAILPLLPWSELIKCENPASVPQILPTAQAVLIMFALGLPITQLINITSAYQRGYWGYLCFLIGRILGFIFVVWCVRMEQPLWLLAGGYIGMPYFVTLIGWFIFLAALPTLRPWPIRPELRLIRRLFSIGSFALIHHISYAMINTSAMLIIANTINAASAVPYSVTQRLLGVSSVVTASLMLGVSVAVGEAWHRRELKWIRKALRRVEKLILLFGLTPLVFFLFLGRPIILWWTDTPAATPTFSLLLALVLLSATLTIESIYSNCLMAMNFVRFIALTKLSVGIIVLLAGYVAGVLSQSAAVIAFLQFSIGALIPTVLFWRKMNQLLVLSESSGTESVDTHQVLPMSSETTAQFKSDY